MTPAGRGVAKVCVVGVAVACTPVTQAPTQSRVGTQPGPESPAGDTTRGLPPSGYGSLRQDEFSIEIIDDAAHLHVKVTPLAERVTRLAAPDTYERLEALARSRIDQAEALTEAAGAVLFLVSFFSRDPDVAYQPEELRIGHRGRSLQPAGILPLTTGWGRQLLQPQETQSAIYVFEPPFDYELPITVRYGLRESDDWHRDILPRLERERTRVESRAGLRPTRESRIP